MKIFCISRKEENLNRSEDENLSQENNSVLYHNHEADYLYFCNKPSDSTLIFCSNSLKDENRFNYFKWNNITRKDFKISEMEAYTIYKS